MTARMLARIPQDRRTALLRCIRERLHEVEAMDRSLARLGEGIDPDDILTEIVTILDEAHPRERLNSFSASVPRGPSTIRFRSSQ